ncbi:GDSL-type esterase/lipase family protein [Silvibacterium acidisoli]|uniref:GDSL-type esterase/lipase family protein n=1 Tax=Acidobacteriaceae bacterium ZG23-2 TaxID=2883246 RepID=UPI00406CC4A3
MPRLHALSISIGGRVQTEPAADATSFSPSDYVSQWPGIYYRAAFRGSRVFFRVGKNEEILHVAVDGDETSLVKPDPGVYEVQNLSGQRHEIDIFIATESVDAPNTFGGFAIPDGEQSLEPAPRHLQMEFIGDSHTVGYGNLSSTHTCTKDEVWSRTDDTKAFGPLTARHYDADYQVNAISGRGVVRNYNNFAADHLPQAYPYVLFDKKQAYSDPSWKPSVLVIALGTNDFSTKLNPGEPWKTREELHADFEATYQRFLQKLRAGNPKAYIIVWATDMADGEIEAEAQKVVQQVQAGGDKDITFLPVNGLAFTACNGHPSLADEQVISNKLIQLIDAHQR